MEQNRMLHIGCGENIFPSTVEWQVDNLDCRDLPEVNIVSSAYPLDSIQDCRYDLVYAAHILEHYPRKDILAILKEWTRVTKPDGCVRISVPDFAVMVDLYSRYQDIELVGPILGRQDYNENFHQSLFDEKLLRFYMAQAGLVAIHKWMPERVIHGDRWDYSQAKTMGIKISLNLEGRKK